MRAYRKGTVHPYCVYLTADEARRMLNEIVTADPERYPTVAALYARLDTVVHTAKREA